MKRFLSILLAAMFLFTTIFTGCGETPTQSSESLESTGTDSESSSETKNPAEQYDFVWEDIPEEDFELISADRETLEKGVTAVAWAMANKGVNVQYEAHSVSDEGAPEYENIGIHHYYSPEFASDDQVFYMQCNSFCVNCIYEAFHYVSYEGQYRPGTAVMTTKYPEGTMVYYQAGVTEEIADRVIEEIRAIIRPGDIIAACCESAHAMLYIGDYLGDGTEYVAHCWGAGYEKKTGVKNPETDGAIYIQPADGLVFDHQVGWPSWDLHTHATKYVGIIRLIDAPDFTQGITKATQTRLDYPGITIDKALDRAQYRGVEKGEEVEVRVSVTNNGTEPYKNLHLKEYIPRGTVPVSGDYETTLDVAPGETKTMAFKVKVIADAGETITFGKGFVDHIRTREIVCNVSEANLSAEEIRKLNVYAGTIVKKNSFKNEMVDIKTIYKDALGADVELPDSLQDFLTACFDKSTGFIHLKETTDENRKYASQIVYKQYGGKSFSYLPEVMGRNLDLISQNYREGDVLIKTGTDKALKPSGIAMYVCLAPGKFLEITQKGAQIVDLDSTIALFFAQSFYFVVRPSIHATGLGKTEAVMNSRNITTEEELSAAIKEKVDELVIENDLKLTKKYTLSGQPFAVTVKAGKTLNVGDFDFTADTLVIEDGAHIVGGKGRVKLSSYSKEMTRNLVKQFSGEAVSVFSAYYNSMNSYDCLEKAVTVVKGNKKLSDEDRTDYDYENLKEAAYVTFSGWTITMGIDYMADDTVYFQDGVTIDLCRHTLALRSIGKAHIKLIDTAGSGQFYIHGTKPIETIIYDGSIDAPGIPVKIGYTASGARSADVIFTGTISCQDVITENGSTYTTRGNGVVETGK